MIIRLKPIFVLARMMSFAWQSHHITILILLLLQGLQGVLPIIAAWITKEIFDLIASSTLNSPDRFVSIFIPLLITQTVITFLSQLLALTDRHFSAELGRHLDLRVNEVIYRKLISLESLAYFEDPKFHDTLQIASQGIGMGPSRMLDLITSLLRNVLISFSFLGIFLLLSPFMTFMVVIAIIPQLFVQLKMGRQRFEVAHVNTAKERKGQYLSGLLSNPTYYKEILSFNIGDYLLRQFMKITRDIHNAHRHQQLTELRWQLGLSIFSTLISSFAFAVVIVHAIYGKITFGDVTLYISALGGVQGALISIIYAIGTINETSLFFFRYEKLMALPSALSVSSQPRSLSPLTQGIEFRGVSFRYTEELPWVLMNVNLTLVAGESLAIVGLNGAGKSTLVKLLTRLYDPTEGQILWDGIDIREFDPVELRQRLGIIFQDFTRYSLTAQENIGFGDVEHIGNLLEVERAAHTAGVDALIKSLPEGYQTVLSRWLVEEKGVDLSGGQWQKIATARMFMRNADILILDEPTAALDAEAEYEIYRDFTKLLNGRTGLLISHRFSTVLISDRIAVLENGKITEIGTHAQLLTLNGTYSRLYHMQAEQYTR